MNYADLAQAAAEASALADKDNTAELHKSAAEAHAAARDARREMAKSQAGADDAIVLGLVDDDGTQGHQNRYQWHLDKSEKLLADQLNVPVIHKSEGQEPVEMPPSASDFDASALADYLVKGETGSDKPAEQKNVEAGTEGDGNDDGKDDTADEGGDEAEAEAAKEEASEGNEGPPPMAKGYDDMSKGLNAWLTDEGEDNGLDLAAEDAFSKSYAELVDNDPQDSLSKGGPYIGVRGGKWADAAHTIPWNEKKHGGGKKAPQAKRHDPEEARELHLYTENDGDLHRQQHEPIRNNLARKMAAGIYDHAQATKLYGYLMDSASKKYAKEMQTGSGHAFTPATRMAAAKTMADQFYEEAMSGDHDHRVPKKHAGKTLKELHGSTEKSFASDDGGLADWLQKGIPGASDHGKGRSKKGLESGVQSGLDERDGYTGNVEVSRSEDGGKLDGVGAEGGIGGGPKVRTGAAGINEVNSAAGDAYGANQGGPDVPQNNVVSGKTGKLDQFTPDDPNDVDKMKDELGMMDIPGAPASAFQAQGGQRSPASQGGKAYGDATQAMTGKPNMSTATGSNPRTGASGVGEDRSQGGPAYGPATSKQQSSMRARTHDPQGGASGTSPGAPAGSKPQVGKPGLHHDKSSSKLFDRVSKGGLDAQTGVPLHGDAEVRQEAHARAQGVQRIRKGEDDVRLGLGVGPEQAAPVQGGRRVTVMMKGGAIYTDASDQECVELLEKGDFGYHGEQPGFDLGNDLTKSMACPSCGTQVMKALTTCPQCGVDRTSGQQFQKSREGGIPSGIPQTHSKGPGLRRPVPERDLYAPDGLSLDD